MKKNNAIFSLWKIANSSVETEDSIIKDKAESENIPSDEDITIDSVWIESFQRSIIIFLTIDGKKSAVVTGPGEDFFNLNTFYGIVALDVGSDWDSQYPAGKGSFLVGKKVAEEFAQAVARKYAGGGFETNTINNSGVTWMFSLEKAEQLKKIISDSGKVNEYLESNGILNPYMNTERAPYYGEISSPYGSINEATLDEFIERYQKESEARKEETSAQQGATKDVAIIDGELVVEPPVKSSDGFFLAKPKTINGKKYLEIKIKDQNEVFATADGKVNSITRSGATEGQAIIIFHDEDGKYQSIIEGLDSIFVQENNDVKKGQKIGSSKTKILVSFVENGVEKDPLEFFDIGEEKPIEKKPTEENRRETFISPPSPPSTVSSAGGMFALPVVKEISIGGEGYGTRFHPIDKKVKHHDGLDIRSKNKSPLFAIEDGIINLKPSNGGYGNTIELIGSEERVWLYGHLHSFVAKDGDRVKAGDTIGLTGSTGKSTGPHLHLELRIKGSRVDPTSFFSSHGIPFRYRESDRPGSDESFGIMGETAPKDNAAPSPSRSISSRSGEGDRRMTFLNNAYPIAEEVYKKYGVPVSVTLAMSSLESGNGEKTIGSANNYFGIQGEGPSGSVEVYNPNSGKSQSFRAYDSMRSSFEDYGRMLSSSSYYSYATKNFKDSPAKFLMYVWGRGYIPDPEYFNSVVYMSKDISRKLQKPFLEITLSPDEMKMAKDLSKLEGGVGSERYKETTRLLERS